VFTQSNNMKKATKQTKTTENQPVTSGNLPQGRAIIPSLSHKVETQN
jgi:hypothetical protein